MQTKTLRQFDERLQDELPILMLHPRPLPLQQRPLRRFHPYRIFFETQPLPAYPIAQLPAAGTHHESAVRAGQAVLANDLSNTPRTEAQAIDPLIYRRSSVLVAPVTIPAEPPIGASAKTLAVIVAVAMEGPDALPKRIVTFEVLGQHIAPVLTAVLAAEERDTLVAINGQVVLGAITLDNLIHSIQPILRNVIHHDVTGLVRFVGEPHNRWFDIVACEGGHRPGRVATISIRAHGRSRNPDDRQAAAHRA